MTELVDSTYDRLADALAHSDEYYTLNPYTNRFGEYYYAYIQFINEFDNEFWKKPKRNGFAFLKA